MLHDALDGHGGGNHVPEASDPHLPFITSPGTQDVQSAQSLQIKGIRPIVRETSTINDLLRRIAISNISKWQYFPVFVCLRLLELLLRWLVWTNYDAGNREVDHEIAFGVHGLLKELDLLDELAQTALHLVFFKLDRVALHALPTPQLLVPLLDELLALGGLGELFLKMLWVIHWRCHCLNDILAIIITITIIFIFIGVLLELWRLDVRWDSRSLAELLGIVAESPLESVIQLAREGALAVIMAAVLGVR